MKKSIILLITTTILYGCGSSYDCDDMEIQPVFIGFAPQDVDTIILRKFKANDGYQHLIDTVMVTYGSGIYYYNILHDTTAIWITDGGIKAGYDWQVFIPAKNRNVLVANIVSEKQTGWSGHGIFSLDPGPRCTNKLISSTVDNKTITFPNPISGNAQVEIKK